MKSPRRRTVVHIMTPIALACALALSAPLQAAEPEGSGQQNIAQQQNQPPYEGGMHGYGHGPYGGYGGPMGPGMMGDYGYGMGPGMMGNGYGYGMGPGMMHRGYGYGMGPGMMQQGYGYGMGPGMMGGYGAGPGMMGPYAANRLGLNEQQRKEIGEIHRETADKNWKLLGEMRDQREKLFDLYGKPELDRSAISDTYKHISKLRQEMFENRLNAQQRIGKVLNAQQQKAWRSMHRGMGWGMMEGYGPE